MSFVCRICDISRSFKSRKLLEKHNCGTSHKRAVRKLPELKKKSGFIVRDDTGTLDRKRIVSYLQEYGAITYLVFDDTVKETRLQLIFRDDVSSSVFHGKLMHIVEEGKPMLLVTPHNCRKDEESEYLESEGLQACQLPTIVQDGQGSQEAATSATCNTAVGIKASVPKLVMECDSDPSKKTFSLVSEQLVNLISNMLPSNHAQVEEEVVNQLYTILKPTFPDVTLTIFGSACYQLGFQDSGMDVCVFGLTNEQFNSLTKMIKFQETKFENVEACAPWISMNFMPKGMHVKLICSLKEILTMNEIMMYLLNADQRVWQLVMAVRYWARVHKVVSSVKGNKCVGTHALTMMVIFYLQQKDILPPICRLQDSATERDWSNWHFNINKQYRHVCRDTLSIAELFAGFFTYYSEFNFTYQVICPFVGRAIPRQMFRKASTLPAEFTLLSTKWTLNTSKGFPVNYLKMMCVQDPVMLDDNLTANVCSDNFYKMQDLVCNAAKMCSSTPPENWLNGLLSYDLAEVFQLINPLFAVVKFSPYLGETIGNPFTWVTRRISMLLNVLEKVNKLNVIRVEFGHGDLSQTTRMVEDRVKIPCSKNHPTVTWLCQGDEDVLLDRDMAADSLSRRVPELFLNSAPPLCQQIAITNLIVRYNNYQTNSNPDLPPRKQLVLKLGITSDLTDVSNPNLFMDVHNQLPETDAYTEWKEFFIWELPTIVDNAIEFENRKFGQRLNLDQFTCQGCEFCARLDDNAANAMEFNDSFSSDDFYSYISLSPPSPESSQ